MTHPNEHLFETLWLEASKTLDATRPEAADEELRMLLWRKQEWHNWFRWWVCRKGRDWSKPAVILLLAGGFAALVYYGIQTRHWYATAGGIVAWFTVVNLSFFIYFGLTLPGPPLPWPHPPQAAKKVRAEFGLYPAGYERRKLARVWLRIKAVEGPAHRFELTFNELPSDLAQLLTKQTQYRMHHGDAPLTHAVLETVSESDITKAPFKILAWQWQEKSPVPFDRYGK